MTFNIYLEPVNSEGMLDDDALLNYVEQLTELFSKSAEGQQIIIEQGEIRWTLMFLEYAADYLDVLPPEMVKRDIEELVFDLFPEEVSAPATDAPQIVHELRAFWQFLSREFQLKNAEQCLQVLTDKAIIKLTKAMSDPSKYGLAKSMVMEGIAQGIDMTDEEQANKWMLEYQQKMMEEIVPKGSSFPAFPSNSNFFNTPSLPKDFDMPYPTSFPSGRSEKAKSKAKKAKRKMKQASQKKNRKHK